MSGEEFLEVFNDTDLRQYIIDEAKCRGKSDMIKEDLVQEAWLCISCSPEGCSITFYKDIALRAIRSAYWQEIKLTPAYWR
jgi:hypothetical protein